MCYSFNEEKSSHSSTFCIHGFCGNAEPEDPLVDEKEREVDEMLKYLGKRKLYQLAKQLLQDDLQGERMAHYSKYSGREYLDFYTSDLDICRMTVEYGGAYLSLRVKEYDEVADDYGPESFRVINGLGRVGIAI